ncbi:hypothetical protein Tco_0773036 [Tanacetum coccineum]|uniref:Uncharacterized protein n=1 Tax=Tanacetum coccineum TaxID=301880 RepID=A0ABQ4ZN37_9ASTR
MLISSWKRWMHGRMGRNSQMEKARRIARKCTREMKELATAALYSVEGVLQSPNAFQKNMKTTCEEVMNIPTTF